MNSNNNNQNQLSELKYTESKVYESIVQFQTELIQLQREYIQELIMEADVLLNTWTIKANTIRIKDLQHAIKQAKGR